MARENDGGLPPLSSESNCSLVIIGEEDEVARAAVEHAVSVTVTRTPRSCASRSTSFLEPAENYTSRPGRRSDARLTA